MLNEAAAHLANLIVRKNQFSGAKLKMNFRWPATFGLQA
ncbi:hypothetical protein IWX85_000797 [Polaromonas sp. CG_9.11]|nr:hypothetical protein [Polaromonas sp. CG_9.11]